MDAEPKHMNDTTHHHLRSPSQPPHGPSKTRQQNDKDDVVQVETVSSGMKTCENDGDYDAEQKSESSAVRRSSPAAVVEAEGEVKEEEAAMRVESEGDDLNVREKLRKHRMEVAGRVWIPEIWGQEELLKDWIDCSAFDDTLVPRGLMSARDALVEEGRRANSGGFRIENRIEDGICEVSQNEGANSGEKLSQ